MAESNLTAQEPVHLMFLCPGTTPSSEAIVELRSVGIDVDQSIAPVVVNAGSGEYMMRGTGTWEAAGRARREFGIEPFPDQPIQPMREET
jgi:hypothetical protein